MLVRAADEILGTHRHKVTRVGSDAILLDEVGLSLDAAEAVGEVRAQEDISGGAVEAIRQFLASPELALLH